MTSLRKTPAVFLLVVFLYLLVVPHTLNAQQIATPVQCGTILEAELTTTNSTHNYTLTLNAGDTVDARAEPIGSVLQAQIRVHDPRDRELTRRDGNGGDIVQRSVEVSASGQYTIVVTGWGGNPIGAYTLYIGCTLRNGTVIAPGDVPLGAQPTVQATPMAETPANFLGFRGLAPVDFGSVVPFSIPAGVPMTGGVTPTGGEILGYLVNGNEGDILELHFTRLSGNLNLGLVVLSQNNELTFQASLVTANSLTTQLILPSAGDYTVGVFRVDLLPPAAPQPTTFQIQAVVNP